MYVSLVNPIERNLIILRIIQCIVSLVSFVLQKKVKKFALKHQYLVHLAQMAKSLLDHETSVVCRRCRPVSSSAL